MPFLSEALQSGLMADVVINVNGEAIPAHKLVLYFRSSFFKTMFDGQFAPKSENGELPVISINNDSITAEHFKNFLMFLYSDEVEVTGDNAFILMNLAEMYDVPSLMEPIEEFLTENLTSENVVTLANSASLFDNSEIFKSCVEFIMNKSDVLKSTDKFCEMNERVLLAVLQQDEGNLTCHPFNIAKNDLMEKQCLLCEKKPVFRECDLFRKVLNWGENQCKIKGMDENPENMKKILEPFLPFIRFPTMTVEELMKFVHPTELFDDSVFLSFMLDAQNIAIGKPSNKSTFSQVGRNVFIEPKALLVEKEQPTQKGLFRFHGHGGHKNKKRNGFFHRKNNDDNDNSNFQQSIVGTEF
uniref:BTB domain-containing protein n=1 Tax=Panagrolaimus sp. JU765 TaxID=591449 RepID=A0AC34QSM5_9BILA